MMARGSAKEVSAILEVGHRFRVLRDDERERGRDLSKLTVGGKSVEHGGGRLVLCPGMLLTLWL